MSSSRRRAFIDDSIIVVEEVEVEEEEQGQQGENILPEQHAMVEQLSMSGQRRRRRRPTVACSDEEDDEREDGNEGEKRPRIDDEVAATSAEDGDDGMTCSICFEEYANAGMHRLVCLVCGHLFGKSCIEKWLRSEKAAAKCPACKKKARLKDIRILYGTTVKMRDTSELQQLKESKAALQSENTKLRYDNAVGEKKEKIALDRIKSLEAELLLIKSAAASAPVPMLLQVKTADRQTSRRSLVSRWRTEVPSDACRALCFSADRALLVLTAQQQQAVFRQFGFRLLNAFTGHMIRYIPVHDARPRDCCISSVVASETLVLSTGEDKCLCITNISNVTPVRRWSLPANGWSCCWGSGTMVFAGLSNGQVLMFDSSDDAVSDDEPLGDLTDGCSRLPVLALCWIHSSAKFRCSGLLVANLKQCTFYEMRSLSPADTVAHLLVDDEGAITSMAYDSNGDQLAITFRPGRSHRTVMHKLYRLQLAENGGGVRLEELHCWTMTGTIQSTMARNALFVSEEADEEEALLLGAAVDEATTQLRLFSWTKGVELCRTTLSGDSLVQHVLPFRAAPDRPHSVAVLTRNHLHCFDVTKTQSY